MLSPLFVMPPAQAAPQSQLIFSPHPKHNHGSCIVELPNGDLLACWYRGSGERTADDVAVMGARLRRGAKSWSEPFVMADTPDLPDTNPCMFVDDRSRLWLFWCTIQNNQWESALAKYRITSDWKGSAAPKWQWQDTLHFKPGTQFEAVVKRELETQWLPTIRSMPEPVRTRLLGLSEVVLKRAADRLQQRLGWMFRVHPFVTKTGRILLPLYSDGFSFSMMAYSDDRGGTWTCTPPLVGAGNVQPTIAQRRDGTLVAYFRDNGPPPKRVMVCESVDNGATWSRVRDTDVADPGAGVEVLALRSGRWIMVGNRTENGRHQLAVSISTDEGRTWPNVKYLEREPEGGGGFSYPSVIQARDGTIHVTYSWNVKGTAGESIKYVRFQENWLLEGEHTP
jgi:predicted neuraminidase